MRVSRWIVLLITLATYVRVVHGYVLHVENTTLVPRATCDTEHKLWFQVGNETMCLPMTASFVPNTLHVEHNGVTYSAGQLELFYEASVFNSCQSVSLPRGLYCVELLGGHGGDGGNNPGSGIASDDAKYECFEVSKTTTVSVFRGGDGNNGSVNSNGNVRSGGGGGASGVPSLFAMENTVFVSSGGAGGTGGGARDYSGDNINCGGGGGGNASSGGNGLNGSVNAALSNDFIVCGGGGGGAVSGTGGTRATGNALIFLTYTADAGSNAGSNAGGAGGAAHRTTSQKAGGNGGNNTTYTCAGTSLVSYGGGGGGGVCTRFSSYVDLNGGDGGSGSTGTSSTSYVRIYRFE